MDYVGISNGTFHFFPLQNQQQQNQHQPANSVCGAALQHSPQSTTGGSSVALMQTNGRKVLGPPENWVGPPPTSACELYVRRIPKDLNDQKLIAPFLRFGRIYEIRLPMDFNQANRGYAYVKYTNEDDAACAMEVLSHYYVMPHRKLEILHSYEKCRLFVSNIPKHIEESEIERKLRAVFPSMQRIYTRGGSIGSGGGGGGAASSVARSKQQENVALEKSGEESVGGGTVKSGSEAGDSTVELQQPGTSSAATAGNRGHVFIHFPTHMHALEAKKSTNPGLIRMWGNDLKVVWANTERDADMSKQTKTLFVRNVDLSLNNRDIVELLVQHVPRTTIRKISKVRTTAFFDFTTREAAEKCLQHLQGTTLRGQRLDLEWAKPSEQQSLHRMRNADFDAIMRLKCIANGWQIPVVVFGTYFELEGLQYGAVMLRDANGMARAIFCILQTHELVDIHSRMCEVVCMLIETIGTFPDYNYVFFVQKDSAHLLGMVTHNAQSVDMIASHGVPHEFYFDFNEIIDLSWAVAMLASITEDALFNAYQESFRTQTMCTYLQNLLVLGHRVFGTIMPKYRNKPPLKHNLNDTQIVLALCYTSTGTNAMLPSRPYMPFPITTFETSYDALRYVSLKLLPIALTQSRFGVNHVLSHIQFGGTQCYYHPAQRIMFPPIWISGCPYAVSIKQPQSHSGAAQHQHCIIKQQQQHQLPLSPPSSSSGSSSSNGGVGVHSSRCLSVQIPPPLTLAAAPPNVSSASAVGGAPGSQHSPALAIAYVHPQ